MQINKRQRMRYQRVTENLILHNGWQQLWVVRMSVGGRMFQFYVIIQICSLVMYFLSVLLFLTLVLFQNYSTVILWTNCLINRFQKSCNDDRFISISDISNPLKILTIKLKWHSGTRTFYQPILHRLKMVVCYAILHDGLWSLIHSCRELGESKRKITTLKYH